MVGHLGLRTVIREKAVGEDKPSLLVATYVVGPFEKPPTYFRKV